MHVELGNWSFGFTKKWLSSHQDYERKFRPVLKHLWFWLGGHCFLLFCFGFVLSYPSWFWGKVVALCSPGWPGTQGPPTLASWVLASQVCTTRPRNWLMLNKDYPRWCRVSPFRNGKPRSVKDRNFLKKMQSSPRLQQISCLTTAILHAFQVSTVSPHSHQAAGRNKALHKFTVMLLALSWFELLNPLPELFSAGCAQGLCETKELGMAGL